MRAFVFLEGLEVCASIKVLQAHHCSPDPSLLFLLFLCMQIYLRIYVNLLEYDVGDSYLGSMWFLFIFFYMTLCDSHVIHMWWFLCKQGMHWLLLLLFCNGIFTYNFCVSGFIYHSSMWIYLSACSHTYLWVYLSLILMWFTL